MNAVYPISLSKFIKVKRIPMLLFSILSLVITKIVLMTLILRIVLGISNNLLLAIRSIKILFLNIRSVSNILPFLFDRFPNPKKLKLFSNLIILSETIFYLFIKLT